MTAFKKIIMMANQKDSDSSIIWNQLVSEIRYDSATGPNAAKEDDYYILFPKGSGLWRILANKKLDALVTSNKYLIHFEVVWINMGTASKNVGITLLGKTYSLQFSVDNNISEIRVPSTIVNGYINQFKTSDDDYATGWEFKLKIRIHDLTLMFGAGNEPTTVEEFEKRISPYMSQIVNIYDYNSGEEVLL